MSVFKKVVLFLVPLCLMIAIILKANGVDSLSFDDKYWRFASSILDVKKVFTLKIPNIPMIPEINNTFLDWMFGFINAISNIINIIIMLVNIVLEELAFIVGFLTTITNSIKDIFMNGAPLTLTPSL